MQSGQPLTLCENLRKPAPIDRMYSISWKKAHGRRTQYIASPGRAYTGKQRIKTALQLTSPINTDTYTCNHHTRQQQRRCCNLCTNGSDGSTRRPHTKIEMATMTKAAAAMKMVSTTTATMETDSWRTQSKMGQVGQSRGQPWARLDHVGSSWN